MGIWTLWTMVSGTTTETVPSVVLAVRLTYVATVAGPVGRETITRSIWGTRS